jgi:hypothetical protein
MIDIGCIDSIVAALRSSTALAAIVDDMESAAGLKIPKIGPI